MEGRYTCYGAAILCAKRILSATVSVFYVATTDDSDCGFTKMREVEPCSAIGLTFLSGSLHALRICRINKNLSFKIFRL